MVMIRIIWLYDVVWFEYEQKKNVVGLADAQQVNQNIE